MSSQLSLNTNSRLRIPFVDPRCSIGGEFMLSYPLFCIVFDNSLTPHNHRWTIILFLSLSISWLLSIFCRNHANVTQNNNLLITSISPKHKGASALSYIPSDCAHQNSQWLIIWFVFCALASSLHSYLPCMSVANVLNVTWTSKGNCLSKFMYAFVLWVWSPLYLLDFFFLFLLFLRAASTVVFLPCAHTQIDLIVSNSILFYSTIMCTR